VSVRSIAVIGLLLAATPASAGSVEGWGRISLGGGYRWVPNWYFAEKAAAAGRPIEVPSVGGPQGTASFGLGVNAWLEVAIDLFAGYDAFTLAPQEAFTSIAYGAMLGGRLVAADLFVKGFMPYVVLQAGPMLAQVQSPLTKDPEKLMGALAAGGGATWRFSDRYGVSLEAKWIYGRNFVTDISGINVGGVWFTASFTIFFPPAPKRDLDVPGF
jgi:hypothetical protein